MTTTSPPKYDIKVILLIIIGSALIWYGLGELVKMWLGWF